MQEGEIIAAVPTDKCLGSSSDGLHPGPRLDAGCLQPLAQGGSRKASSGRVSAIRGWQSAMIAALES